MKNLILLVFLWLLSQVAFSQWKKQLTFGASYYTGNVEKLDLLAKAEANRKTDILESKFFAKADYSESDNQKINEEYLGGLVFNYKPNNKISPFASATLYQNKFKDIKVRFTGLAGAKWLVYHKTDSLKKDISNISFKAALMYEHENYTDIIDKEGLKVEKDSKNNMRLSFRPEIYQRLSKSIYLTHFTDWQPNAKDFGDYRIDSKTTIASQITKRLSLGLSYVYQHISKPASETTKKTDQVFLATLIVTL